jgi:hypothetical protein
MQAYRHTPITEPKAVVSAFGDVQSFIRQQVGLEKVATLSTSSQTPPTPQWIDEFLREHCTGADDHDDPHEECNKCAHMRMQLSYRLIQKAAQTPPSETRQDEQSAIIAAREPFDPPSPAGATDPCKDCEEAAKHAYSDATTPGFFSPKCQKHRDQP